MLNLNSPTVQAMLNNLPQGIGNMPVYYGNAPTITTEIQQPQQQPQQFSSPFPSPKDMITQVGQNNIYSPVQFTQQPMYSGQCNYMYQPRNIVGGYNPGYQAAFGGYTNPYMGYNGYYYPYNVNVPMDEDARMREENARFNGVTYDEQLVTESNLYKAISRIVSRNIGRTEEEANVAAATFDIYNKYPQREVYEKKPIKPIHICLKIGDTVIADKKPQDINIRDIRYDRNVAYIEQMKYNNYMKREAIKNRQIQMYNSAVERKFDNMNLLDFFNNGAGEVMADMLNKELYMQSISSVSQVYDRDGFRKRLLEKNGLRPKSEQKAVERYVGRYGIMPDGRPVSPGHDPAVATSFSYDPKTGQYHVTAPNFISNKLEQARTSFMQSIDNN